MGAENSNALYEQLLMVVRDACLLVPGLSELFNPQDSVSVTITPAVPQDSVSVTITPAVDLNPAYSNSPSTLDLVLVYFRYNFYAPLLYLALVKHRVDLDDDDDDVGKSMMMVAPELVKEPPLFGGMSAAKLLEEIHKWRGLLLKGLRKRKRELEEELTSIKKWRRGRSEADLALSILFAFINSAALMAAKVIPASITALLLASFATANLLVAIAMKSAGWWFSMTDDKRKSQLKSQMDKIDAMLGMLRLPDLDKIRSPLDKLRKERDALHATKVKQSTLATDNQADQGGIGADIEREVEEKKKKVEKAKKDVRKKKKVEKAKKDVRKLVERIEGKVKKRANDYVAIISNMSCGFMLYY